MTPSSPFLHPGPTPLPDSLAILHLRRDHLLPTVVRDSASKQETGYAEGHVANTRFGSYPHSTLLNIPWGSQVLASDVDTGSRGRPKAGRKRKFEQIADDANAADGQEIGRKEDEGNVKKQKVATAASSGFCHILPPTPESWTVSLPHRTQVVYTPDYSFILQKLRVRPGSVVVEAGAGSGSFTHAAARAVYDGYSDRQPSKGECQAAEGATARRIGSTGKVYSFEYHEPRARELRAEIEEHGLQEIVQVTHRDVYRDGFTLPGAISENSTDEISHKPAEYREQPPQVPTISPQATHVFLDLPAPWLALPHLTRNPSPSSPTPLNPQSPVHLCAFLPCIEQATRTISVLRQLSYVETSMQELQYRRIDVRRERTGLHLEGLRGVNAVAGSVEESLKRLVEVERGRSVRDDLGDRDGHEGNAEEEARAPGEDGKRESKTERLARILREEEGRKTFREGRLVHRTEADLKCHTSYLVFAVLPREWNEEEEARAREEWPVQVQDEGNAEVSSGKKRKKGKARKTEGQADAEREVADGVKKKMSNIQIPIPH